MEIKRYNVEYQPAAFATINDLAVYLIEKGYPKTAIKFVGQLYEFGHSIGNNPLGYPVCRFLNFSRLNLHCAVFKKYVFIFKIKHSEVIIYNIVHSSWLH